MPTYTLPSGETVLFDKCDAHIVESRKWHRHQGYAVHEDRSAGRRRIFMHRLIMNPAEHESIDHINRNRLDNRRLNLRVCLNSQNAVNRKSAKGSHSRFLGVSYNAVGKSWRAECSSKLTRYVGYFPSEIEAAIAYDVHAIQMHGEFASLNFPMAPYVAICEASKDMPLPPLTEGLHKKDWRRI